MAPADRAAPRRPRLRTLLLGVNLVILLLPLAGIGVLRVYQSALVRPDRIRAGRAGRIRRGRLPRRLRAYRADARGGPLRPAAAAPQPPLPDRYEQGNRWQPRPAKLDLSTDQVLPAGARRPRRRRPDRHALAVGGEITALMREAQLVTLAAIRVVDPNGTVVASTGEELGLSLSRARGSGAGAGRRAHQPAARAPFRRPDRRGRRAAAHDRGTGIGGDTRSCTAIGCWGRWFWRARRRAWHKRSIGTARRCSSASARYCWWRWRYRCSPPSPLPGRSRP
ncbi:MAG: hypothetical protein MZV65_36980 [Chromatiales bacterium]|nr:hypothetical protein [Chromatiales bacterium]